MLSAHNFTGTFPATVPPRIATPTICITDEEGLSMIGTFKDGASKPNKLAMEKPRDKVEQILRERALQNKDTRRFWPELLLKEVLTETVIAELLPTNRVRVHEIATHYRKVLAILILLEKEDEIEHFIRSNVRDEELPLPIDSYEILRNTRGCFRYWKYSQLDSFREEQYEMTPLFFDFERDGKTVRRETLKPRVVLPFLKEEGSGAGGCSDVTKVEIESRSHGFDRVLKSIVTNNCFAVKRISHAEQKKKDMNFETELRALERFSGFIHEHLVTLLMSWKANDDRFLLFVWAKYDLDEYWIKLEPPIKAQAPDVEYVRWIAKQIAGMAGALDTMHNFRNGELASNQKRYARHGDIKPENILWYESPSDKRGIWVLADLGLTTFNSTKSRSAQPGRYVPVTLSYRPPECDLIGGVVSRSSDVWTYGCVLLELVCWALGGQKLRAQFATERETLYTQTNVRSKIFFEVVKVENGPTEYAVSVKQEVSKWIAKLHGNDYCSKFFHEILTLVEDEMITLMSAQKRRIQSRELHRQLDNMKSRVNDVSDSDYLTPCPYPLEPKTRVAVDACLHENALQEIEHIQDKLKSHPGNTQPSLTQEELTRLGH